MKRILGSLGTAAILVLTGCSVTGEQPIKDDPNTLSRLADHVVELCEGAVSAAASIDGLIVTFEEDFTEAKDIIARTNRAAESCLRKISEEDLSPRYLVIQVMHRSLSDADSDEEPGGTAIEATYQPATISTAVEKLDEGPASNVWELADDLHIQSEVGTALVEAAD